MLTLGAKRGYGSDVGEDPAGAGGVYGWDGDGSRSSADPGWQYDDPDAGRGGEPAGGAAGRGAGGHDPSGLHPGGFDLEKAVFDPQGRAVFLSVRVTDEIREQVRAFTQNELGFLLVGVLYARQPFELQGKRYGRGCTQWYWRTLQLA